MPQRTPINISSFDSSQRRTIENLYDIIGELTTEDIVDRRVISLVTTTSSGASIVGLTDLSDITISGVSDNDFLVHNGSRWTNEDASTALGSLGLSTNLADLTDAEAAQLENIGSVTISNTQWGYLGAMDQGVATSDSPDFTSLDIGGTEVIDSSRNASFVGGTFTGGIDLPTSGGVEIEFTGTGGANIVSSGAQNMFVLSAQSLRLGSNGTNSQVILDDKLRLVGIPSETNITIGSGDVVHYRLANNTGILFGGIGLEATTADLYIGTDNDPKALLFDRSNGSQAQFGVDVTMGTAQIQTLRTTLFRPENVVGMAGEVLFSAVTTVVSIDTGANEITVEDAIYNVNDAVVVSSGSWTQLGFSNVFLTISSDEGASGSNHVYGYTVDSGGGSETDIEQGDTVSRVSGDLLYINATDTGTSPSIAGYDDIADYGDSPFGGTPDAPVWELRPDQARFADGAVFIDNSGIQFTAGGSGATSAQAIKWGTHNEDYILSDGGNAGSGTGTTTIAAGSLIQLLGASTFTTATGMVVNIGEKLQIDGVDKITTDGGFVGNYYYTGIERTVGNPEAFNTGIVATNGGTLHVWASVGGIAGAVGVGPDGLAKVAYTTGTDIGADTTGNTSTPDTGDGDNGKINVVTNTNEVVYIVNKLNISNGDIYWLWMAESD